MRPMLCKLPMTNKDTGFRRSKMKQSCLCSVIIRQVHILAWGINDYILASLSDFGITVRSPLLCRPSFADPPIVNILPAIVFSIVGIGAGCS